MIDPGTGEVFEGDEPGAELVPLNLAALDEDVLLSRFPSPVQAAGALMYARSLIADAPKVLHDRSKAVKDAKRQLIIARGYARQEVRAASVEERRIVAEAHPQVIAAWEHLDTCELALEYAREMRKTLSEDIEILRSLNANFRGEHK